MKILGVMFCIFFLWVSPFVKVKTDTPSLTKAVIERLYICIVISIALTAVFGLPTLGIMHLINH